MTRATNTSRAHVDLPGIGFRISAMKNSCRGGCTILREQAPRGGGLAPASEARQLLEMAGSVNRVPIGGPILKGGEAWQTTAFEWCGYLNS
jgi:hypothetical protein